jgi:anti-sigma factor RsiW
VTSHGSDFATIHNFIVGRLSDNERQAFEERLVRDAALVRELEHSLRMREGLQRLRTHGYFTGAAPRAARSRAWMPALIAATAAGLVLFLWLSRAVGPAPILTASLEQVGAVDMTRQVAAHFTFVSMRGALVPALDLPDAGLIEIRVAPGTLPPAARYRVLLVRQQEGMPEKPVAEVAALTIAADGYVHCYADASRLAAGSYVLRMQPDNNSAGVQVFSFNLHPRAIGPSR